MYPNHFSQPYDHSNEKYTPPHSPFHSDQHFQEPGLTDKEPLRQYYHSSGNSRRVRAPHDTHQPRYNYLNGHSHHLTSSELHTTPYHEPDHHTSKSKISSHNTYPNLNHVKQPTYDTLDDRHYHKSPPYSPRNHYEVPRTTSTTNNGNFINATANVKPSEVEIDKDERIRKLEEEMAVLRKAMELLKAGEPEAVSSNVSSLPRVVSFVLRDYFYCFVFILFEFQ
jgi:hypothetical protein